MPSPISRTKIDALILYLGEHPDATQLDLANRFSLSQSAVSKILSGSRRSILTKRINRGPLRTNLDEIRTYLALAHPFTDAQIASLVDSPGIDTLTVACVRAGHITRRQQAFLERRYDHSTTVTAIPSEQLP